MRPWDYLRAAVNLVFTTSRLERTSETRPEQFRAALRRFKRERLLGPTFEPFRDTDQFKAPLLYSICKTARPEVVVETGVANGASSFGILLAMEENGSGHLYSIDLPNATYQTDRGGTWTDHAQTGALVPASLRKRWTLRIGPSRDALGSIANLSNVHLFYHDSEHTSANMTFELEWAIERLIPGGLIVVDNVNWNSAFSDFCKRHQLQSRVVFPFLGIARRPIPP